MMNMVLLVVCAPPSFEVLEMTMKLACLPWQASEDDAIVPATMAESPKGFATTCGVNADACLLLAQEPGIELGSGMLLQTNSSSLALLWLQDNV